VQAWRARAEQLETLGMRLVKEATGARLTKTPSNGLQMSPKFTAGLKLLEAASDLWARLYRIAPSEAPPPGSASQAESLDSFRQRRHAT
jgi:hypothetical protein